MQEQFVMHSTNSMQPVYRCKFTYHQNLHLSQIYAGFELLELLGLAELDVRPGEPLQKPLLEVVLNNKTTILYDLLDGFNWIDGSVEENINYFRNSITHDHVFKRSYKEAVFNSKQY